MKLTSNQETENCTSCGAKGYHTKLVGQPQKGVRYKIVKVPCSDCSDRYHAGVGYQGEEVEVDYL